MEKKEFRAESKRLLDLMIHSIYTHKEIFLRELISNASDAIDKLYYKALTDDAIVFNKSDYYISISVDEDKRQLIVSDTGIGMSKEELEENLGIIANSGSLNFKQNHEIKDGYDIIGQFGVGFYSAFMVASEVTVVSKAFGSKQAWKWTSTGADGYTIEPSEREQYGTDIILTIKEDSEKEEYTPFIREYRIREIIKKYSDFIRYPIKMQTTEKRKKEDSSEFETVKSEEILNSMVPIWKRQKNELEDQDYTNFYHDKRFGFDEPVKHIHINIDGMVRFHSILYVPSAAPFDYYSKGYQKGLELYSSGVLIMERCEELLPDYFSFIKGIVDSEDLSLNISREMLQHTRELKFIAKKLEERIKDELLNLLRDDRKGYEKFFRAFGKQLKYGLYMDFGTHREVLQDLVLFHSSKDKKQVSLKEYIAGMQDDQRYIYYAAGGSWDKIDRLPQTERVKDLGYEILYLVDEVDEFAIKMLREYEGKEFKSVSDKDLGLNESEEVAEVNKIAEEYKSLFERMKEILGDQVTDVRPSLRLKSHAVCLSSEGELSIEMEKILASMPDNELAKAEKVLEINTSHPVFDALKYSEKEDAERFKLYTELLYNQARLIEGLPLEDPVKFTNDICKLM